MGQYVNPIPFQNDEKGRTTPFARLDFYVSGTFDRKNTYADAALTVLNSNPVVADGAGRFPQIFMASDEPYRVVFSTKKDASEYTGVWTADGVSGLADATDIVLNVASIADLPPVVIGNKVSVTGYHPGSIVGGGDFVGAQGVHDGVTTFDPTRTYPTPAQWAAGPSDPAVVAWFDDAQPATACYQRVDVTELNPLMAGLIVDRVTDSALAISATFKAANGLFVPVTYAGISEYAIGANAAISVNTDVDFCGAEIVILGGVNDPIVFSNLNTLYVFEDPDAPLVEVSGPVTGDLKEGSRTPTKGLFDGYGFAVLEAGLQIPNRDADGTQNYEQSFCVARNGECVQPLSVDLSAYQGGVTVNYRLMSKKKVTVKNLRIDEDVWNNQHILRIERNNVVVDGVTYNHENGANFNNSQSLIKLNYVCNVHLKNVISTGMPVTLTVGSYVFGADYVAEIYLKNIQSPWLGWGSTGTNHVNGMYYSDCAITRIDVHGGCHNLFADNCELLGKGIVYGWGGGLIKATNCRYYSCIPIESRGDYGGNFFGDIILDGAELENPNSIALIVMDISAGASVDTVLPKSLIARRVHRKGKATGGGSNGNLRLDVTKRVGAGEVEAPVYIEVSDWTSDIPSYLQMNLEFGDMNQRTGTFRTDVVISRVRSARIPAIGSGVITPAPTVVPSNPVVLHVDAADSDMLLLEFDATQIIREIKTSECGLCGVLIDPAQVLKPVVSINGGELRYVATGYGGSVPIGSAPSGNDRKTKLVGTLVYAADFDLSNVASSSGVSFLTGATVPLIPGGATFTTMFTGYQAGYRT